MNEIWKILTLRSLPGEIWAYITGFNGLYAISNLGRVKSLPKQVQLFNGGHYLTKEKILKQRLSGCKEYPEKKYLFVALFNDGERKDIQVHRLVGELFVPNPKCYNIINHLKGITTDNRASELEWTTYSGNLQHAYDIGLNKGPCKGRFGINHPSARKVQCLLTGRVVSVKDAADWLSISTTHMSSILKGLRNNWTNFIYYGT